MAAGMLVFEAQRVEEGLKNALICWDALHGRITTPEDAQRRIEDRRSVSRFLDDLHEEHLLTDAQYEQCKVALRERNRVIHRLLREEGMRLATPPGRQEFFLIITTAIDQMILAGREVGRLLGALAPAAGIKGFEWHSRQTSAAGGGPRQLP